MSGELRSGVVELEAGGQSFALPASSSGYGQQQHGDGCDIDILEREGFGEIEVGEVGQVEQFGDEVLLVAVGHGKRQVTGEQCAPCGGHAAGVLVDRGVGEIEASGEHQSCVAQFTFFFGAMKHAFELPQRAVGVFGESQSEIPGWSVVPGQPEFIGSFGVEESQAIRIAEPGDEQKCEWIGDTIAVGRSSGRLHSSGGCGFGGDSTGQHCEQFSVFGVRDRVDASSTDPHRFPFAPSPVGSALALGGLQDQLALGSTLSQVDFVDNVSFGVFTRGVSFEHLVQFIQPSFPVPASGVPCKEFGKVLIAVGHIVQQWRIPVRSSVSSVSGKRRNIIGRRTSGQQSVSIDDENGGPEVSAGGLAIVTSRTTAEQLEVVVGVQQFGFEFAVVVDDCGQ